MPDGGLFAGHDWRISPTPFQLGAEMAAELEKLGRVLLQFNKAVNRLYRQSVEGKQPEWVARWLDLGKPAELDRTATLRRVQKRMAARHPARPAHHRTRPERHGTRQRARRHRPDGDGSTRPIRKWAWTVIGGADGMMRGFAGIFGDAPRVHIVVSEERRPTGRKWNGWPASSSTAKFKVRSSKFDGFSGRRRASIVSSNCSTPPNVPNAQADF